MLAFRQARPEDLHFVCDAWSRSIRAARYSGFIDMDHWTGIAVEQCKRYCARPYVQTIIGHEDAAWARSADIYGFIVADTTGEVPFVYMTYTKDEYRRRGYGRALFAAAGIDPEKRFGYLCSTPAAYTMFALGKIPLAKWDPLPMRFGKDTAA